MAQPIEHWWGTEFIFSRAEKEELLALIGISGGTIGADALAGFAIAGELTGPLVVVLIASMVAISACNLVGSGGFRVVLPRITLPGLPPGIILPN
jgi:hypothetical protein